MLRPTLSVGGDEGGRWSSPFDGWSWNGDARPRPGECTVPCRRPPLVLLDGVWQPLTVSHPLLLPHSDTAVVLRGFFCRTSRYEHLRIGTESQTSNRNWCTLPAAPGTRRRGALLPHLHSSYLILSFCINATYIVHLYFVRLISAAIPPVGIRVGIRVAVSPGVGTS